MYSMFLKFDKSSAPSFKNSHLYIHMCVLTQTDTHSHIILKYNSKWSNKNNQPENSWVLTRQNEQEVSHSERQTIVE